MKLDKVLLVFAASIALYLIAKRKAEPGEIGPSAPAAEDQIGDVEANIMRYDVYVMAAAIKHDVEPALIAAIMARENPWGDPAREAFEAAVADVSVGLMQIRRYTAADVCDLSREELKDPELNIGCGAKYLAQLRGRFGKYIPALAAAYNSGPGKVKYDPETGTLTIVNRPYVDYVLGMIPTFRAIFRRRWGSDYYEGIFPAKEWRIA